MHSLRSHSVEPQTDLLHITHQINRGCGQKAQLPCCLPCILSLPTDQERLYTNCRHMQRSYHLPVALGLECRNLDTVGTSRANTRLEPRTSQWPVRGTTTQPRVLGCPPGTNFTLSQYNLVGLTFCTPTSVVFSTSVPLPCSLTEWIIAST